MALVQEPWLVGNGIRTLIERRCQQNQRGGNKEYGGGTEFSTRALEVVRIR